MRASCVLCVVSSHFLIDGFYLRGKLSFLDTQR